jgi:L-malate glycosyltransferase
LSGVPYVAGFRVNIGYWMKGVDRLLSRVYRRWIDGTVANCQACVEAAVANDGAARESVVVIPNGLDIDRFAAAARVASAKLPAGSRFVGITANLRPVKNVALFIRAAARLAALHADVRFRIAGEGELRPQLQALIASLGLEDRVELLGTVADVPTFLRSLDVAVLCSLSEGSPNAIMEYMAAGLPAVVTDVGGNAGLIQHERTGLLIPSASEDDLAAAIDRLLSDHDLAARLGSAAQQKALDEYGAEAQARRYEDFYWNLTRTGESYETLCMHSSSGEQWP